MEQELKLPNKPPPCQDPAEVIQHPLDNLRPPPNYNGLLAVCAWCCRYLRNIPGKTNKYGMPYQAIGAKLRTDEYPELKRTHTQCINCYHQDMKELGMAMGEHFSFKRWLHLSETHSF